MVLEGSGQKEGASRFIDYLPTVRYCAKWSCVYVGIMLYEFRKVRAIGNFLKKKIKSKT